MSLDADFPGRPPQRLRALLIAAAFLAGAFSVVLANGGSLFYFDTVGYVDQGTSALRMLVPDDWLIPDPAAGTAGGAVERGGNANTVNGSRSAIFSLFLAILYQTQLLPFYPLLCTAVVLVAVWLPLRVMLRGMQGGPPLWMAVLVPLLAACAGSLPFYLGFLMPDIFAAVLILICATLVAVGPQMRRAELLAAAALGLVCVLVHPSHLLIAAVMVPGVALLALAGRQGWWLAPFVVLAMLLGGIGERLLFRTAVETVTDQRVAFYPFLTARLIADGPGLDYLDARCPDAAIPTCLLHEALSHSEDPMRLTATHIVFEKSPELGSFRRMPEADQKRVAEDQRRFVAAVVLHDPMGFAASLLRNTTRQAVLNSIEMTVPSPDTAKSVAVDLPAADLGKGRLIVSRSDWLAPAETLHTAIYALSLAAVAILLVWPGRLPRALRLFAVAILLGLAVNAFVCGVVSQPANRYGARVIWLLPMLAALLAVFAGHPAGKDGRGR